MIPFIDLQSQYKRIASGVEERVLKAMRGGQYILGPEVGELERALAAFTGSRHCISCASGTDALLMALMAQGIGPGDAVFCPTFTFIATAEVVALLGATPVFVDIDLDTYNIDPAALEAAVDAILTGVGSTHAVPRDQTGKPVTGLTPRAIIAVDLFGLPANYAALHAVAQRHDLLVIEDAAQGYGGLQHGRRAGSLAPVGCTSFFPAKPLGCFGDGGALFTDDDELANQFKSIRVHGQGETRYEHVRLGITGRLDSIQAAVLLEKLAIFADELDARDRAAKQYSERIATRGLDLITPKVPEGSRSAWAQYCLLARDGAHRDACQASLKAAGVPTMIYYPLPLHLQPTFAGLGYRAGDFPLSEDAARRIFAIPMHPYLEDARICSIVDGLV